MKKLLPVFLFTSFIACNNTANNPAEAKTGDSNVSAMAASASDATGAAGCGSLIIFHKGAVIEGKDYDTSGKVRSSSVTTVTNVSSEGNETIADLAMDTHSNFGGKEHNKVLNLRYKCDGKRLAMDLSGFLSNFSAMKESSIEGKSLEFPLELSVGQELPEASVSATIDAGRVKMKTTSTYANRRVEKKESISTPAGTWSCFKIVNDIETSVDAGSDAVAKKMAEMMKQRSPKMSAAMWFAPGFGVVRSEFYKDNKLDSRSEIVSVKK
jgi:hypothetical protein